MAEKQTLDWDAHGEYVIEQAKTRSCTQIAQEFDVTSDLIRRWLWRRGISAVKHVETINTKTRPTTNTRSKNQSKTRRLSGLRTSKYKSCSATHAMTSGARTTTQRSTAARVGRFRRGLSHSIDGE